MEEQVPASEFIRLGEHLAVLMNLDPFHVNVVEETRVGLLRSLDVCGLERSRIVAQQLEKISAIPYSLRTGKLPETAREQVRTMAKAVASAVMEEAAGREILPVSTGVVLQNLKELRNTLTLNDTQVHLHDEVLICLRSGAYRAAAVMVWNLTFDFVRQWTFDNHLAAFNGALRTGYVNQRTGQPMYDAIGLYSDFFSRSQVSAWSSMSWKPRKSLADAWGTSCGSICAAGMTTHIAASERPTLNRRTPS